MRFLRRGSGDSGDRDEPQVPGWADFLSRAEYARFMDLVYEWLRANTAGFREHDGAVEVDRSNAEPAHLGLTNLAQVCKRTDPADWAETIDRHFRNVMSKSDELTLEFEQARPIVKVRLYAEDYLTAPQPDDPDKEPIGDVLAPGLRRMLVLDLPTAVRSLNREFIANWGKPIEELWELGLSNVRDQDAPDRSTLNHGIELLTSEGFFVTSWALLLDRLVDPMPEHGVLVIAPNRHALAIKPVTDATVLPAISDLLFIAENQYRQGPGSISPSLYWWRDGRFTILPSRTRDKTIQFMPPDEFVAVLNSLAGD